MKVYRENIIYASQIVVAKEENFAYGEFPLHNHKEYELILIIKGSGKKFVGDSISSFSPGELCFMGPNLPHTFYNRHLPGDTAIHQVVIQFCEDFLGNGFFDHPAFQRIRSLFEKSERGLIYDGEGLQVVRDKIRTLPQLEEAAQVIELLSILHILSSTADYQFICSHGFNSKLRQKETDRMSSIYDYMLHHFREDISLSDVASVACLSPEAFCRYFKKHTRKTFFAFLADMRIGYACRLLQENKHSVYQVSLQSGFNNISYFNRKFKLLTRKTPVVYQRSFAGQHALV